MPPFLLMKEMFEKGDRNDCSVNKAEMFLPRKSADRRLLGLDTLWMIDIPCPQTNP
jgi:hypothetical protein